jgi:hypothetical protein
MRDNFRQDQGGREDSTRSEVGFDREHIGTGAFQECVFILHPCSRVQVTMKSKSSYKYTMGSSEIYIATTEAERASEPVRDRCKSKRMCYKQTCER